MSEQTKYPARGEMSEDGKLYTDESGVVHAHTFDLGDHSCAGCSLFTVACSFAKVILPCGFKVIEGAYVPSAEELAACDMARSMIMHCGDYRYWAKPADIRTNDHNKHHCSGCHSLNDKSCPARTYLAKCGQPGAWEVK